MNCENCGNHVSQGFARTFSGNGDGVHACPDCSTWRDIWRGGATGETVAAGASGDRPGHIGTAGVRWTPD